MKKTSIVAVLAAGIMTVAATTAAFAEMNPAAISPARVGSGDVKLMPGSDTAQLHFAGAELITNDAPGALTVFKADGTRMNYHPNAFQVIGGKIRPVDARFRIDSKDQVTVEFGKLDKNAPVILKRGAAMYAQPAWM